MQQQINVLDPTVQLIAVAIFIAGVVSPVIVSIISAFQAWRERKHQRWQIETERQEVRIAGAAAEAEKHRQEKTAYLSGLLNNLLQARAELQYLQGVADIQANSLLVREREKYYGMAYAAMLSSPLQTVQTLAGEVMKPLHGKSENSKLAAIDWAIQQLGDEIVLIYES